MRNRDWSSDVCSSDLPASSVRSRDTVASASTARTDARLADDDRKSSGGVGSDGHEVGDKVEARFRGGARWYGARVTAKNRDGTYDLHYDDGDRKSTRLNSSH